MRNVEIKAKIGDYEKFICKAAEMSDQPPINMRQTDTYFKVPKGRLKLRQIKDCSQLNRDVSELIFYDRPNVEGPKLSNYSKQDFVKSDEAEGLKKVLESSLGILGIIKKKRTLFMVKNTRIHVDEVENLGHFMELEVGLLDDETVEQGQKIADELMSRLEVFSKDLIAVSYIDLLINQPVL